MQIREAINLVEAALSEVLPEGRDSMRPSPEDIEIIRAEREEIRAAEGGGGYCHFVSEFIFLKFGWDQAGGTVTDTNGDVICSAHRWNILPDGAILDATADQFGRGHDIVVIPADSPEHACYRLEWDIDHNPKNHNGHAPTAAHADTWDGEMDFDHENRLAKARGRYWHVTHKDQHDAYRAQQRAYAKANPSGYYRDEDTE